MATIYNTIKKIDGSAYSGVVVFVSLSVDPDEAYPIRDDAADNTFDGAIGTETDTDGYWSVDGLIPNDDLTPSTSVYKIEERAGSQTKIYYVSITDAATPTFWVGDILTGEPAWL